MVFGLIGPNGAGKTTTLRILATILKPDSGDAWIMGRSVVSEAHKARKNLAYLPEEAGVYKHLTGKEFFEFIAGIYGRGRGAVERGAAISGLEDFLRSQMSSYSKGMRRRIWIAAILISMVLMTCIGLLVGMLSRDVRGRSN